MIFSAFFNGRLFLEGQSASTLENIRFSAKVIDDRALSKNIATVTDGFHQHRAQVFAKREGLTAGAIPASRHGGCSPFTGSARLSLL